MSYEPRYDFVVDLEFGEAGETDAQALLRAVCEGRAHMLVEVKTERYFGTFYVEEQQRPRGAPHWRPSGINTTKADFVAYLHGRVLIGMPTVDLVNLMNSRRGTHFMIGREMEIAGGNPTRGRVLTFRDLMVWQGALFDPHTGKEHQVVNGSRP